MLFRVRGTGRGESVSTGTDGTHFVREPVPSTIFSRGGDSPIPSHTVTHANPFPQRNLITNQPTCQLSHHRCTDVLGELGAALILLFDALRLSVLGLFVNVLRSPTLGSTGK